MNKKYLLVLAVLGIIAVALCWFLPAVKPPPNFVVIIADDLGWSDVGAYGNNVIKTPAIDALASNGIRFENAFLTTSSCSPSRASILTGKYPHSNGLQHLHQPLPKEEVTVAKPLKDAGYYTASIGKWHIGNSAMKDFDKVVVDRGDSGSEHWITALQQRPKNKPFFMWLASNDPHRPYPQQATDLPPPYSDDVIEVPDTFIDGPGSRRELAQYYREITRFDNYVEKVVSELRRQGVLDNTLIIIMSDNGRPFHLGKMMLYDDGIKTPFILNWPGFIPKGVVNSQMLSVIDLAPTLLDLAGLDAVEGMQGRSFAPMLNNSNYSIREEIFAERNWHGRNAHERAVRSRTYLYKENQFPLHGDCYKNQYSYTGAYKELKSAYLEGKLSDTMAGCFSDSRALTELFSVSTAGVNYRNLAADPKYTDVLKQHRLLLQQWREQTQDKNYTPYQ